ncbi:MAG: hypothetical protein ACJAR2_000409 [Ilumatobacter sp.]|jgi:hypothetical protein
MGLAAPIFQVSDLVAGHEIEPAFTVTHEHVFKGDEAESLWDLYESAIGPLDEVAALRHLDAKEVVMGAFADSRITKVVGWAGNEPIALSMITKHLELVPETSPAFFRNRFPERAEDDTIFYGMAVLVKPTQRGMSMFSRICIEVLSIPAKVGGVMVFDTCKFNRDNFAADEIIGHIVSTFPKSTLSVIDQQTWFAAEMSGPLN